MRGSFSTLFVGLLTVGGAAGAASPAQLGQAKTYVDQLYKRVVRDDFDYRSPRYAPELARWIKRDDACARKGGGICAIEAEPFCDCQDSGGMKVLGSRVAARGPEAASVTVDVSFSGRRRQPYTIDLVLLRGQWYVRDIHTARTPSFLAFLKSAVPAAERAG